MGWMQQGERRAEVRRLNGCKLISTYLFLFLTLGGRMGAICCAALMINADFI